MELQEKYKPQLEEGITNSVYNELFFFSSKDEVILHRNSMV